MNDLEFEQRATVNPFDDTPEFLAAVQENLDRQRLVDELKAFESDMAQAVSSVNAPASLKQKLLDVPLEDTSVNSPPLTKTAANDSFVWTKRLLPVAACLLLTIGIAMNYWPSQKSELELEIFAHIYYEAAFLDIKTEIPMSDVNQKMFDTLGVEFEDTPELENLQVHVAGECWVAKENAIHMVMEGNAGALSVIMLPNSPLKEEVSISDDRFEGLITPTPGGNLVVVGEKGEAISQYSYLLASNISW